MSIIAAATTNGGSFGMSFTTKAQAYSGSNQAAYGDGKANRECRPKTQAPLEYGNTHRKDKALTLVRSHGRRQLNNEHKFPHRHGPVMASRDFQDLSA